MDKVQSYTVVEDGAIVHYPIKADGSSFLAPIPLCEAFEIKGQGKDREGISYYIVFHENRYFLIPRGEIGTNEGWRKLRNFINIPSQRKKLDLLTEFIQLSVQNKQWTIVDTAGWHGVNTYILPNGEIMGESEKVIFNDKIAEDKKIAFSFKGDLSEWQENIGQYAQHNTRMALALGVAFGAPLLKILNIEGGVIHLYGQSTGGKTTIQKVAQSVWGHGRYALEDWDTTSYALTNTAMALNDGFLALDEISKDQTGEAVKRSIYAIANGKGRTRGNIDSGNRSTARFRVLALSTGETDLETHLNKHGFQSMAGELIRCPSVTHKLECCFDFTNFQAFSEHLSLSTEEYYGTAGRVFISHLICLKHDIIKSHYQEFIHRLSKLSDSSQLIRTAKLFAIAMTGIYFACKFGILEHEENLLSGIEQCFKDWIGLQPEAESYEEDKILRSAMDFIQVQDNLFLNLNQPTLASHDCPGYKEMEGDEMVYYVFPKIFRDKICYGFDSKKVIEVLSQYGWLDKGSDNRWQHQVYGVDFQTKKVKRLGRFYKFIGISPLEKKM